MVIHTPKSSTMALKGIEIPTATATEEPASLTEALLPGVIIVVAVQISHIELHINILTETTKITFWEVYIIIMFMSKQAERVW